MLDCLGQAWLTIICGDRVGEWDFLIAEIGADKGIPGKDFAVANTVTVWPHNTPDLSDEELGD